MQKQVASPEPRKRERLTALHRGQHQIGESVPDTDWQTGRSGPGEAGPIFAPRSFSHVSPLIAGRRVARSRFAVRRASWS